VNIAADAATAMNKWFNQCIPSSDVLLAVSRKLAKPSRQGTRQAFRRPVANPDPIVSPVATSRWLAKEFTMFVRNAWYIAAWADELGQKPLARRNLRRAGRSLPRSGGAGRGPGGSLLPPRGAALEA
jgi:hypothetical protein